MKGRHADNSASFRVIELQLLAGYDSEDDECS